MPTGTKIAELYYQITGDSSLLDVELKKSESKVKGFGSTLGKIGSTIAKGFAIVTTAITGVGAATLGAASNAEETQNKFGVVFSSISKQAETAAKSLENNYGLSSRASKQLLSDTGDLLSGFGFTQKAALNLSLQTQKLAVDLASFTNYSGGAKGASEAITAALLGETERMKGLGVSIQQNTKEFQNNVKAVMEATGATEQQAKAQVILNEIMKQSKNSIGDFARSQESFANQSRILQSRFEDFVIILGDNFLPVATDVIKEVGNLIKNFKDNEDVMYLVGSAADALGVTFSILFDSIQLIGNILGPIVHTFVEFSKAQEDAARTADILAKNHKSVKDEFSEESTRINQLAERYKYLKESEQGGIDNTEELKQITKEINDIWPESIGLVDASATSYQTLAQKIKQAAIEEAAFKGREAAKKKINDLNNELKRAEKSLKDYAGSIDKFNSAIEGIEPAPDIIKYLKDNGEYDQAFKDLKRNYGNLVDELTDDQKTKLLSIAATDRNRIMDLLVGAGREADRRAAINQIKDDLEYQYNVVKNATTKLDELNPVRTLIQGGASNPEDLAAAEEERQQAVYEVQRSYADIRGIMLREEAEANQEVQDQIREKNRQTEEEHRKEIEETIKRQKEGWGAALNSFDGFVNAMFESRKSGLDKESAEYQKVALAEFNYNKLKSSVQAGINGAEAATKALAALGPIFGPIAAGGIAAFTAGQIAFILSKTPPKFAGGGIVPGNQFQGDNVIAAVNSGEMILNQDQQQKLFNMLDGQSNVSSKPVIINIYTQDGRLLTRQVVDTINNDGEFLINMNRISEGL